MKHYVNRIAKQLFTPSLGVLVIEKLKILKKKKRGVWRRRVNRLFNFWLYGHLINRLYELGELHGVRVEAVNAVYTSQTCPLCGQRDSVNRQNEAFTCIHCGFADDADYVGAVNVRGQFAEQSTVTQINGS
jgi:putative transposase